MAKSEGIRKKRERFYSCDFDDLRNVVRKCNENHEVTSLFLPDPFCDIRSQIRAAFTFANCVPCIIRPFAKAYVPITSPFEMFTRAWRQRESVLLKLRIYNVSSGSTCGYSLNSPLHATFSTSVSSGGVFRSLTWLR